MMPFDLRNILGDFVSIFFPKECACCGCVLKYQEKYICIACDYHLPYTNFHTYSDNDTARQLWGKAPIEEACSFLLLQKGSRVERLIYQIKYNNQPFLAEYFGYQYGLKLLQSELYVGLSAIVPIPLHTSKLRKRGYNQSAYFGRGLSRAMHIPLWEDVLIRKRATMTQTGKDRLARYENVEDIFVCKELSMPQDAHILLVDDVLTTGATIVSAAITLQESRGCKVSVATLARAQ
ncbi:phosphoribosyltransferase family protein [Sphingobacterium sp. DR205]|uniref:ComF family protein n=1 Tax=Sphingobacterium sp. DR205 TaxID=2713573 RepID=UPI0013E5065F|nr:phosphoribosyltransferase family protein [Sphingobacterium sp. DR205]QIH36704.1 ComF family protein [Sphingobacterium sp. DR205]